MSRRPAGWIEAPQRGAVVVTPEAALVTWRACGMAGVRAATVSEPEAVVARVRQVGANLLVVEPFGQSIYSLKHLFATFRRGGPPKAPILAGGRP